MILLLYFLIELPFLGIIFSFLIPFKIVYHYSTPAYTKIARVLNMKGHIYPYKNVSPPLKFFHPSLTPPLPLPLRQGDPSFRRQSKFPANIFIYNFVGKSFHSFGNYHFSQENVSKERRRWSHHLSRRMNFRRW